MQYHFTHRYHPIMSERTNIQENPIYKSTPHVKIHFSHKSTRRQPNPYERSLQYKSQRYSSKHREDEKSKKISQKAKIYRSYSQAKNKSSKKEINNQNQNFLIRIPKNQNLIENYIQQLKQLKQKVALQKNSINELNKQKVSKRLQINQQSLNSNSKLKPTNKFLLKIPEVQSQQKRVSLKQDMQLLGPLRKTEQVRTKTNNENKMLSRDMKRHLQKLKMFKEFVDENQLDDHNEIIQTNRKIFGPPKEQSLRSPNNQACTQVQSHRVNEMSIPFFYPKKLIYGNVINLKQQFKLQPSISTDKKFNRYSTESGRRLYSISKSIDLRSSEKNKKRNYTEQKDEENTKCRTLIMRRKTEQARSINAQLERKHPLRKINIQQSISENQKINKQKTLPQTQRSPTKNKSPQKNQQFKSIEGFSTIEDRKETIDILGQSCLEIKKNLIESHKKMDHILDLLECNMIGLDSGHKEKKRKHSFERFSKAFPKGFFK